MKLEVGMYVRTKHGLIFKIIGGNQDNWEIDIPYWYLELIEEDWFELYRYNDNGCWFTRHEWESSFNIIDLIEVGDYVNSEKVIRIYEKGECYDGSYYDLITKTIETENENYETIPHEHLYTSYSIQSVLTHEQFDAMKYEVK